MEEVDPQKIIRKNLTYFHLEQMSDSYWWMVFEDLSQSTTINVGAEKALCPGIAKTNQDKSTNPSYEIRLNDDGSLDEVVACHPQSLEFRPLNKHSWQITLISKENHVVTINFGTQRIVKTFTNIENEPASKQGHRCILC